MAASGVNGDITSLTGLTSPLPVGEGGTGSAAQNFVDLGTAQDRRAGTLSTTIVGSISGNASTATTAASVLNGVYTTGSYTNPAWLASLDAAKLTGTVANANLPSNVALTSAANTFNAGTQDFSGAGATLPVRALLSAAAPASCVASKEMLVMTDASPGQQLFLAMPLATAGCRSGTPSSTLLRGHRFQHPHRLRYSHSRATIFPQIAAPPPIPRSSA